MVIPWFFNTVSLSKNKFTVFCLFVLFFSHNVSADDFSQSLVDAAIERTQRSVLYNGSYRSIPYPDGDVPDNMGVCTDVVIRSYRKLGIDLQRLVHEDMKNNFDIYPSRRIWGLTTTDTNIDHRRVPNLQMFFSRAGRVLSLSENKNDYAAGDIVTWMLPGNLPHIGIISDQFDGNTKIPLVIHNIGSGPEVSDVLFRYRITGHYQYRPSLDKQ